MSAKEEREEVTSATALRSAAAFKDKLSDCEFLMVFPKIPPKLVPSVSATLFDVTAAAPDATAP